MLGNWPRYRVRPALFRQFHLNPTSFVPHRKGRNGGSKRWGRGCGRIHPRKISGPGVLARPERTTQWYEDGPIERFCVATVTASSPQERETCQRFLKSFSRSPITGERIPDLFAPPDTTPLARIVCHEIRLLPNVSPAHRPPFMLGEYKLKCLHDQMSEVAQKGWIKRSVSPWSAPPFLVAKKPNEPPRTVIDYRDLNAVTINESVPLPRLEVLLHRARNATVFSKLDLASGFHQIALTPDSQPLSAFCLPEPVDGCTLWEWTVMPFGLKNAPPTFQRAMTVALAGCEAFCMVYLDDILVFSETPASHLDHLRRVFQQLTDQGFHARLGKCHLCKPEVEFLGHRLNEQGLTVSQPKVQALQAWSPPFAKRKQVRQFLGLALWYKTFVPHLATLAVPLFNLVSSTRTFKWTRSCIRSRPTNPATSFSSLLSRALESRAGNTSHHRRFCCRHRGRA